MAARRKRKSGPAKLPAVTGGAREELAVWMKQQFERQEAEHQERLEVLRTVGEHPSALFSGMVRRFAGLGMDRPAIAHLLGVPPELIAAYYLPDIELGAAQAISLVAANMMRIATSDTDSNNAKVGMGVLDRRGGEHWKPPAQQVEMDDKRAAPPIIDSSKLTYQERQEMRTMLTRIANGGTGDELRPDESGAADSA